jgi:predicted dehydrogenase
MLLCKKIGEINKVIGFKNSLNNFKPNDDINIDGYLFFEKNVVASIQSLDMKSYDNFDIIIYGTKGKIEITDIGRKILKYKVIKSPEHTGFTELSRQAKILTKSRPRNQFGMLSKNAVSCLINKNTKPLCDEKDSFRDMLIIDRLLKSANTNSKKLKI